MDIYEVINKIVDANQGRHWNYFRYSFTNSYRSMLDNEEDLRIFDLLKKTYSIEIAVRSKKKHINPKQEYIDYCDLPHHPFSEEDVNALNQLDCSRLPHFLVAHVNDYLWIFNHKPDAARRAADEYFRLYKEVFNPDYWVRCVDAVGRAVELATKLGDEKKREEILGNVYQDVINLNGSDPSFLSITLIELLLEHKADCDYKALLQVADNLIARKSHEPINSDITEQSYELKAKLYTKLKDTVAAYNTFITYADELMAGANNVFSADPATSENRDWFIAEEVIKKAIFLYQNHGASEKAVDAQRTLIAIQKEALKHLQMHEFKYDVSEYYQKFIKDYGNHNVHELIVDLALTVGFQDKAKLRTGILSNGSPLSMLFPMQMLGSEGQTEFVLPGLNPSDEENMLQHMFYQASENEIVAGQTVITWFIQLFLKKGLQESDLDFIFSKNHIIPAGQEKDVQRGVYLGLTGHMSDALDKLAPKAESIIRSIAEMCGDLTTYYDPREHIQQKRVLGEVFKGKHLNECVEENILFTFNGLLQQKAGSNIRNRIGHGLINETECRSGDCVYFVALMLKFCAFYSEEFWTEVQRRRQDENNMNNE